MALSIPFLSSARCVLMLTDESLFVYDVTGTKARFVDGVAWSSKDFETKVSELISRETGGKSILILNDMVEQHYRKERVPKISPLDRGNIIKRKLGAAFPAFKVRAALALKEKIQPKKTRDGKEGVAGQLYLFAAVPPSDSFIKTLEASRRSMADLSGYALLPVEAGSMVHTLSARLAKQRSAKKVPVWSVFIGQHRSGGLRQIVTKNGELALTRITPVIDSDNDPEVWASEVAQEFQSTVSYLTRFGYNPEDGLDVIVIAKPSAGEVLENLIDVQCNFVPMTATQAAHLLGLSIGRQDDQRYADPLHAAWIGRKSSFTLPMQSVEVDSIAKPRKAAKVISLVLAVSLLYMLYSATTSSSALITAKSDLKIAIDQKSEIDKVYEAELARKASMGIDVKKIRASLEIYNKDRAESLDPLPLLKAVSDNLQTLRIDSFDMALNDETIPNPDPSIPEPIKTRLPSVTFLFSFPGDTKPMQGNGEMEKLTARIQKALPGYKVELTKKLADLSYTGQVESEAGLTAETRKPEEKYTAEIQIKKLHVEKKEGDEGNSGS